MAQGMNWCYRKTGRYVVLFYLGDILFSQTINQLAYREGIYDTPTKHALTKYLAAHQVQVET